MFWTVVVVWPMGSMVSGSMPMANRRVPVPVFTAGADVGAPAGAVVGAPAGAAVDAPAGAAVGLGAAGAQAASSAAPPAPITALRKVRRDIGDLRLSLSCTLDLPLSLGGHGGPSPSPGSTLLRARRQ